MLMTRRFTLFAFQLIDLYTSEVSIGKYIGIQNPYLVFSVRAKTFFVGFSYFLNTEMTIDKNVRLSASL